MLKPFLKRICLAISLLVTYSSLWAQNAPPVTIDDTMRSHDKIYVVMAVCLVILVVFFLYLIRIDRKVSKKEKTV